MKEKKQKENTKASLKKIIAYNRGKTANLRATEGRFCSAEQTGEFVGNGVTNQRTVMKTGH